MKFTLDVPEALISPFMKIVLRYRRMRYGYSFCRIPLTEGKYAIVDAEDYGELRKFDWYYTHHYYAATNEIIDDSGKRKPSVMHRKIMKAAKGLIIDHINRDRLDNRKANLRIATQNQNACNKETRPHTSKYRGVSFHKALRKWQVYINHLNKRIYLGVYADEVEAAKVYDEAAKKYHGEFAMVNFQK